MSPENAAVQADTVKRLFQQVPFLEPMTKNQLADLVSEVEVSKFGPGIDIVEENSPGKSFYIIESGHAVVYKALGETKLEIARLNPGDFFGEMALLQDTVRSASVRAETQVRALKVTRAGFRRLLGEVPEVALAVMQELGRRLRETDQKMIDDLLQKNEELQRAHHRLEQSYDATLIALSNALDLRDSETEGHSVRVARIAVVIGEAMGLSDDQLRALRHGGLLHDLGKIGVPDAILRKGRELSSGEWEIMRQHPTWGAELLSHIDFLSDVVPLIHHHHEAWDGSGYPDGLAGEDIPLLARIFAVADTYDSISSDRPYQQARSPEEALAIIKEEAGRQFDPAVVAALEWVFPQIREEEG